MLISPTTAAGIADGSVTLAFRRWDRPRMRGSSLGAGVLPKGAFPTSFPVTTMCLYTPLVREVRATSFPSANTWG